MAFNHFKTNSYRVGIAVWQRCCAGFFLRRSIPWALSWLVATVVLCAVDVRLAICSVMFLIGILPMLWILALSQIIASSVNCRAIGTVSLSFESGKSLEIVRYQNEDPDDPESPLIAAKPIRVKDITLRASRVGQSFILITGYKIMIPVPIDSILKETNHSES